MFSINKIKYLFFVGLLGMIFSQGFISSVFAAQVFTQGVSSVGTNTATLNSYITRTYTTAYPLVWFEWGTSPNIPLPNTTPQIWDKGNFYYRQAISNLSPNTTYFFRIVAQDAGGTTYGSVHSFKTKQSGTGQAVVSTNSVSALGESSATVSCYFDPQGNTGAQRWLEWGRDASVTTKTEKIYQGTPGSYSILLTGLSPNTIYYFRCGAETSQKGVVYGTTLNFTTLPTPIYSGGSNINNTFISGVVLTKPASDVTSMGARLNSVVLPGSSTQAYGWFEWGSTPNLGFASARRFLGAGQSLPTTILFDEALLGLTPNTTYFFKPVIQNQNGIFVGTIFSFRTPGGAPSIVNVSNTSTSSVSSGSGATVIQKPSTPIPSQIKPNKVVEKVSAIKVEVIPSTNTVIPKERMSETVTLENTTNTTLKGVVVHVVLPCEAEYLSAGGDTFTQNGKMLSRKVGEMKPKEKIDLVLWMDIQADVPNRTPIETIAVVNWEDNVHPDDTESVGRAIITLGKNKTETITTGFFSLWGLGIWGFIIGFLFLLLAGYLAFFGFRRKGTVDEKEIKKEAHPLFKTLHFGDELTPNTPDPVKKMVTEKTFPPENLPV